MSSLCTEVNTQLHVSENQNLWKLAKTSTCNLSSIPHFKGLMNVDEPKIPAQFYILRSLQISLAVHIYSVESTCLLYWDVELHWSDKVQCRLKGITCVTAASLIHFQITWIRQNCAYLMVVAGKICLSKRNWWPQPNTMHHSNKLNGLKYAARSVLNSQSFWNISFISHQ